MVDSTTSIMATSDCRQGGSVSASRSCLSSGRTTIFSCFKCVSSGEAAASRSNRSTVAKSADDIVHGIKKSRTKSEARQGCDLFKYVLYKLKLHVFSAREASLLMKLRIISSAILYTCAKRFIQVSVC